MKNRIEGVSPLPPADRMPKGPKNNEGAAASGNLPFPITPKQAGKFVDDTRPEKKQEKGEVSTSYEKIKERFISTLEEAVFKMEAQALNKDGAYFRRLVLQLQKNSDELLHVPLWFFEQHTPPGSNRIFDTEGRAVLMPSSQLLEKYSQANDMTKTVVLPNFKPSLAAQHILLEGFGVEPPEEAKDGKFAARTSALPGFYKQIGPAENPDTAFFHFPKGAEAK